MADSLVIDDLAVGLARLSDLGRQVVAGPAMLVRAGVAAAAAARGWPVLDHRTFSHWAAAQVDPDYIWLIADPLIDAPSLEADAVEVRVTRRASQGHWQITDALEESVRSRIAGREVGLLDDAAWSGQTLQHLGALISRAGGFLSDVIVCASTDAARAETLEMHPEVAWAQYQPGSTTAIHLRDACPCLPFSGKRIANHSFVGGQETLAGAYAPTAFRGGLWEEVLNHQAALDAVMTARRLLSSNFNTALGRPATIADVRLLGRDVAVPLCTRLTQDPATPIADVLL